ncbi:hypothetical protein GGS23DRAFT_251203 [Durotheca rogersii]|uniref:uncharacterized protein n=1 Tax=Durotheca rogersii TaxID=419775 RepID=UPI0022211C0E|nr:uncharacterized protein GGS23DRAFT_251203 [Durotheca rogersii]KAI5860143.1 hypothetical protein GGS23DRAFT_251203 [Durotheca rogersii]
MKCRHCNEEGHLIRDCPTAPPQEFTGECRYCKKEGHMAKDCPEKPPIVCHNCKEEGHTAMECKNARNVDFSGVRDVDDVVAWESIKKAASERDLTDVKEATREYLKSHREMTYVELEAAFRAQGVGVFLIATEKPSMVSTYTNMDLQGNLDKKYCVTYRLNDKPARPREAEFWPRSPEENMERLKDAGETVERGVAKCSNCNELGHIAKRCPHEKVEKERIAIMCYNCEAPGHRIRDCTPS